MRKWLFGFLFCFVAAPLWAVCPSGGVCYVDGGCIFNGNGNGADCASSPNGNGAFNVLYDGSDSLIKTLGSGEILDIRGVHAITKDHASSANHKDSSGFDGRYYSRQIKVGFSSSPSGSFIRAHGWTGAGTGEVYTVSGTRCPHPPGCTNCDATFCGVGAWVQCSTCSSGFCAGIPGVCNETWHTIDDGTAGAGFQPGSASDVTFAQSETGPPVFMVGSKAELATPHTFASTRCSLSNWKTCSSNSDCYPASRHGTCTATAAEVQGWKCASGSDSSSCPSSNRIFVHWGSSLPFKPYIAYNYLNTAFDFGSGALASKITMQGGVLMDYTTSPIHMTNGTNGTNGITLSDVGIFYIMNGLGGNGGCRGIEHDSTVGVIVEDSEIAYTADEGIHAIGKIGVPTDLIIRRNWFHDQISPNVFGATTNGTPSSICLGDDGSNNSKNDFTGTDVYENLFTNNARGSGSPPYPSPPFPFRIETASNWKFHDNVISSQSASDSMCILIGQAQGNQNTSSNTGQIYNNIFNGCPNGGIEFNSEVSGASCNGHAVFNNTFVNVASSSNQAIYTNHIGGTVQNNLIRNNLLIDTSSAGSPHLFINWAAAGASSGNSFKNNLLWSQNAAASTVIANISGQVFRPTGGLSPWDPTRDVDGDAAADANLYTDPGWAPADITAADFRLRSVSPAINAGTMTGMPARDGINNVLASRHGLPDYSTLRAAGFTISSATDIGAWEGLLVDGGFESGAFGTWLNGSWRNCNCCSSSFSGTGIDAFNGLPGHPIVGNYSLRLGHVGTAGGSTPICEAAHVTLTNLDPSRLYTLTGTYYSPTPVNQNGAALHINYANGPKLCEFLVGFGSNVNFSCAFLPPSDSMDLTIETVGKTQDDIVFIDNLDLR